MKLSPLSIRIKWTFAIMVCLLAVNIAVLLFSCLGSNSRGVSVVLLAADALIGCGGGLLIKKYIIEPYRQLRMMYQAFVDGQVYEELFQLDTEIMPEWKAVMKQFHHLVNKQDAIKMSKKQAEYLALQNQINPHFLYNALESIRGDALLAGIESIAETTEALAIYFRYTITQVDRLVTLEDEIDNVENYFTIQKYRFGEKLKLDIQFPEEEEVQQLKLPKLTLQPFIENAVFHGLEKKKSGGTIHVKVETTDKKLIITITDDGVGMEEAKLDKINRYLERVAVSYVGDERKRGSIAMKNVNSRIKLLFGEDYGIHVYSTEGIGTDVVVTLPKTQRDDYETGTV